MPKLGFQGKAYIQSGGTWASPTWVEVDIVRDVQTDQERGEADVSSRASEYELTDAAMIKAGVDFQILANHADTNYELIRDAFLNNTGIEMAIMSEAIATAGSEGLHSVFKVFKFSRGEPLKDGAQVFDVSIKPSDATDGPEWLESS